MDSFKKYYDRLKILEINDNKTFDQYMSSDLTIDLSSSITSQEYFEKVDCATTNLASFFLHSIETRQVRSILYNYLPLKEKRKGDLLLCFMIDILRCFEGLNHPTNLSSPEGIALLILLTKLYSPQFVFTYESLSEIPEKVINLDAIVPYIYECSAELGDTDELIISKPLQNIDSKADILYRELIYHFCEAISKADGHISILEKEWLMSVLRLDDDNPDNDIIIDSNFSKS